MIEIYPTLTSSFSKCPACGCQLSTPGALDFYGQYQWTDILCSCCDEEYYHTYPVRDKKDPDAIAFTKDGKKISSVAESGKWTGKYMAVALKSKRDYKADCKIEIKKQASKVVLYNLIYNSENSVTEAIKLINNAEMDSIVIVQEKHRDLIKHNISEIWTVKVKNGSDLNYIPELKSFISKQLSRFEKVFIFNSERIPEKGPISWWNKILLIIKSIDNASIRLGKRA